MPIANCIITSKCQSNPNHHHEDLIEAWSNESKVSTVSTEHMTVNIIAGIEQFGKEYDVMASLLLPAMWSHNDISSLQLGLARALAQHYNISINSVHVTTSIINSGMVVEAGKVIEW